MTEHRGIIADMSFNLWISEDEDRIRLMSRTTKGLVFCWMDIAKSSITKDDSFTGVYFDAVLDMPKTDDPSGKQVLVLEV